jgi:hypothetical protein
MIIFFSFLSIYMSTTLIVKSNISISSINYSSRLCYIRIGAFIILNLTSLNIFYYLFSYLYSLSFFSSLNNSSIIFMYFLI